jgi:hypothetical protein
MSEHVCNEFETPCFTCGRYRDGTVDLMDASDEEHYGCEFCGADFADLAEMEAHVCPNDVRQ